MKLSRRTTAAALVLAAAGLALAGPLNPPAGPVTSTMKTLADLEPRTALTAWTAPGDNTTLYKITAPGSYYLTGDIWVPPGRHGVVIAASPVTIDLNGFAIYGLQGSHEGITTDGQANANIVVKNGLVAWMNAQGVNLSMCSNSRVESVATYSNGGNGIRVGNDCTVARCDAAFSVVSGIQVGDRCTVSHCTSTSSQYGFQGTAKDTFENCAASEGTIGFNLGSDSSVRDCQALHNTQQGIIVMNNCTITENQCRANGGTQCASIWAQGDGSTIQNNQTTDSAYGVYAGGNHNTISGNTFNSPTQRAVSAQGTNNLIIQNVMHNAPGGIQAVAFNRVGAILVAGYNPQLINGTSGGGLGITDPYANLIIN